MQRVFGDPRALPVRDIQVRLRFVAMSARRGVPAVDGLTRAVAAVLWRGAARAGGAASDSFTPARPQSRMVSHLYPHPIRSLVITRKLLWND